MNLIKPHHFVRYLDKQNYNRTEKELTPWKKKRANYCYFWSKHLPKNGGQIAYVKLGFD